MSNEEDWYVEHKGTEAEDSSAKRGDPYKAARAKLLEVLRAYGMSDDVEEGSSGGWQAVLCPFHGDRRASASINLRKMFFRCHGCGIAGTAIAIVMEQEGLDRREAAEWIMKL